LWFVLFLQLTTPYEGSKQVLCYKWILVPSSLQLLPMYPMIGAVALGIGLAGYTMTRTLFWHPEVQ
jgi:hypothetical protein